MFRHLEDSAEATRHALIGARLAASTLRVLIPALALAASGCSSERTGGEGAPVASSSPPEAHVAASASDCKNCHARHFEEWSLSSHAYAMKDPVFQAMVRVGQRETQGDLGEFCTKCHTPIGSLAGKTRVRVNEDTGDFEQPTTDLDRTTMEGVSCLVCHSITNVRTKANAEFDMSLDDVRRGTIKDPDPNLVHESAYSELHHDSGICGTCHVVVNPKNVALEETFIEWMQSPFNGAQTCQDCHMPTYQGTAAFGHRERTVHEHGFAGADVSLLPEDEFPGYEALRDQSTALLRKSATLTAAAGPSGRTLEVTVKNHAGHALPSGATADRQMWIEVVVRDSSGGAVFESGTLDEEGDLRVSNPDLTTRPGTDPSLVLYAQEMRFDPKLEEAGSTEPERVVHFLWEPNLETTSLVRTSATDERTYDLAGLPPGTYSAKIRLLFRSFPPHLLRLLERLGGLDPEVKNRVPTVEMATAAVDFTL